MTASIPPKLLPQNSARRSRRFRSGDQKIADHPTKVTTRIIANPRATRKAWLRERIVDPRAQAREPMSEPSGTDQHT
jgi:hypothetical protein